MATKTATRRRKNGAEAPDKRTDDLEKVIEDVVERVLKDKLGHILEDVSWRLKHFYELADKIPAEGLNLQQHLLTGYTLTNNSPTQGSIEWADLHVVYQGQDFGPYNGDTNLRYTWFDYDNATNKIQSSNTKPTLEKEDVLLFINDNGIGTVVPGNSQVHGAAIRGGTVDSAEIKDAAIIGTKILDGAVGTSKIANSAVDVNKLANGAVSNAKLQNNAVASDNIQNGAVGNTKIANSAVTTDKIQNGAVSSAKIANSAVTTDKIENDAVSGAKIAGGAVNGTHIAGSAVETAHLADAAVIAQKLAAGAVSASKLNLLLHTIY